MIIEAKANRQANQPADPRQKFEFNTPEKLSRLPAFVALLITGVAAYLQSIFPSAARADEPVAPRDGAPAAAPPHDLPLPPQPLAQDDAAPARAPSARLDPAAADVALAESGGFRMVDPVSFTYTAPIFELFGPQVAAHFPAAFGYQPQNDNEPSPFHGPSVTSQPDAALPDPVLSPPTEPDDEDDDDDDEDDDDDDDNPNAPANRAPMVMGPVRLHDVFAGQAVLIGLSQLLLGASDPDCDTLTINDLTVSGGTLLQVGAAWSFVTMPGMLGVINFTYDISDGLLEIMQTASLQVVRNSVLLTPWDDVFVGTPFDDDIDGLAGDDSIDARAGNDIVAGGLGDDHINGGDDDDQLFGGVGDDVIFGGRGNDIIGGGDGNDRLFGEDGDDIIDGDAGNDSILGGAGADIINGGDGDDTIEGNDGDDVLIAGAGNDNVSGDAGDDIIDGNDGDDLLAGGAGHDIIDGGAGDDSLAGNDGDDNLDGGAGDDSLLGGAGDDVIRPGSGNDTIDGGDGHDSLDYSEFTADIHLNFEAGIAWSDEIDEDLFDNIEQVIGGQGNDCFEFGTTAAIISGGPGDDLFIFSLGEQPAPLSTQLMFQILDFLVGDQIHVADYEISHRAERLEQERFGEIYDALEEGYEAGLPIKVSHAFYDDLDHTIIEADVDRNDVYEISITLDGVNLPLSIGHTVA